jgi:hypothetical protein
MKMSPEYQDAGRAMAPGGISPEGFFGDDARALPDIIQADEEEMRRLGLDFEETAAALERIIREGGTGLGAPVTVEDVLQVTVEEVRGLIPCPFRDGRFPKNVVRVARAASGAALLVSSLSVHLLRAHHFLQGRGSAFRLEPAALKALLER